MTLRSSRHTRWSACCAGALILAAVAPPVATASADPPPVARLVPVFSIAKSENKNQVQYVVQVDDRCALVGPTPVSAYWKMLEIGPTQTAPLLSKEQRAYGLASQQIVASTGGGGQVRVILKALPDRPLTIATSRGSDGVCRALATGTVAGSLAHLFNVYVHLKWDGVDSLLVQGWSMDGSHVVRETIKR
jgi:Domain of unknown function (DUF4833)